MFLQHGEHHGLISDDPRKPSDAKLDWIGRANAKTSHDWQDEVKDRVDKVDRVPVGSPKNRQYKTNS